MTLIGLRMSDVRAAIACFNSVFPSVVVTRALVCMVSSSRTLERTRINFNLSSSISVTASPCVDDEVNGHAQEARGVLVGEVHRELFEGQDARFGVGLRACPPFASLAGGGLRSGHPPPGAAARAAAEDQEYQEDDDQPCLCLSSLAVVC